MCQATPLAVQCVWMSLTCSHDAYFREYIVVNFGLIFFFLPEAYFPACSAIGSLQKNMEISKSVKPTPQLLAVLFGSPAQMGSELCSSAR